MDLDSLPYHQFITRTHLNQASKLPDFYSSPDLSKLVHHFTEKLKGDLEDAVKFELFAINDRNVGGRIEAEDAFRNAESMVNQISRLVLQGLSEEGILKDVQVDYRPKSEAFWLAGGFDRSLKERNRVFEKKTANSKVPGCQVTADDPIGRNIQFIAKPILQIRSEVPLGEFSGTQEDSELNSEPPPFRHPNNPAVFGDFRTHRYAINISGHWSGDQAKHNLISFHSTHFLNSNVPYSTPPNLDRFAEPSWIARVPLLLHSQAVIVSFSKLLAQAYTLGFDQFSDIDYPLTSQTVLTNGTDWSFYAYQLNTIQLDNMNIHKNRKQNICWGLPSMKILDDSGNLNTNIIESLLKFYLSSTLSKGLTAPTPHLREDLDEVTDGTRREFILHNFHAMYSQKRLTIPTYQMPEIYNWERIYKINHQKMPMDARKRLFEQPGTNPYTEKYVFKDPKRRSKRLKFLEAELAEKKEKERIEHSRAAQSAKFRASELEK